MPSRILDLGGATLPPSLIEKMFEDLELKSELKSKRITIDKEGVVKIKNRSRRIVFEKPLSTRADLQAMLKAIGKALPDAVKESRGTFEFQNVWDVFCRARAVHTEQNRNTKWFRNQDDWHSELKPEYRSGKAFDLPLMQLPRERVEIRRAKVDLPELDTIERYFDRGGYVAFPVHPQEVEHNADAKLDRDVIPRVRNASSDRTLHTILPGTDEFLLKLPLPNIYHDTAYRPIESDAAHGSVDVTEFLKNWIDSNKVRNDSFAFLPEAMSLIDKQANSAVMVRSLTPYPPPKNGEETWLRPTYSLYAPDDDFPDTAPMMIQMMQTRPDQKEDEIDYFMRSIFKPMLKSAMRVSLDLGSSNVPHGQNLFLEIGENGQPTGRGVHADLESMRPHPEMARFLGRQDFYKEYGYSHSKTHFENKVWDTFRVYFLEAQVTPLLNCLQDYFPERYEEAVSLIEAAIKVEIRKREKVVKKFRDGPLKTFHSVMENKVSLRSMVEFLM